MSVADIDRERVVNALNALIRVVERMHVRQTAVISMLATKMRMTPQSRWTAQSAATAVRDAGGKKPWEE